MITKEHSYESRNDGYCQVVVDNCKVTTTNGKVFSIPKGTILYGHSMGNTVEIDWYLNSAEISDTDSIKFIDPYDKIDLWMEPSCGLLHTGEMKLFSGDILHQPENSNYGVISDNAIISLADGRSYPANGGYISGWDYDESNDTQFICWEYQDGSHMAWAKKSCCMLFSEQPSEDELNRILQGPTNGLIYA